MFLLAHPFVITIYTVFSVFLSRNYLYISSSMATHTKWRKLTLNLCYLIKAGRMQLLSKCNFLVFHFLFIKWETESLTWRWAEWRLKFFSEDICNLFCRHFIQRKLFFQHIKLMTKDLCCVQISELCNINFQIRFRSFPIGNRWS